MFTTRGHNVISATSILFRLASAHLSQQTVALSRSASGEFCSHRLNLQSQSKDSLAETLKAREQVECGRKADRSKPLVMRLDGRSFHTFTKGLNRPYDARMSKLMIDTTMYLVQETGAKLGYTQSDEISLYWSLDLGKVPEEHYIFNGRFQKMSSVVASMASAFFNRELPQRIPEKASELPAFDSRVWNVEDAKEVYLNFLWRQNDAVKNSIATAAQALFKSKELHRRDGREMRVMLRDKGKPWEDEPAYFQHGTFVGRVSRNVELSADTLAKIPEAQRPQGPVVRTLVCDLGVGLLKDEPPETLERLFGYREDGGGSVEVEAPLDSQLVV